MSSQDRYVPLLDIPDGDKLSVASLVPVKSKIRVGAFLFEAISVNDGKQTVTFRLTGFFPPEQPPEPAFN